MPLSVARRRRPMVTRPTRRGSRGTRAAMPVDGSQRYGTLDVQELLRGALVRAWGPDRRRRLEHHLTRFGLVGFDRALCLVWATMMVAAERRGRVLAANDGWIAATTPTRASRW